MLQFRELHISPFNCAADPLNPVSGFVTIQRIRQAHSIFDQAFGIVLLIVTQRNSKVRNRSAARQRSAKTLAFQLFADDRRHRPVSIVTNITFAIAGLHRQEGTSNGAQESASQGARSGAGTELISVLISLFRQVHCSVRGAQYGVSGCAVLGIEGDAHASAATQCVFIYDTWLTEGALKPLCHLLNLCAIANHWHQNCKFVSSKAGEHVVRPKLPLHAQRYLPKIHVSDAVAIAVIHMFEIIEIDVD